MSLRALVLVTVVAASLSACSAPSLEALFGGCPGKAGTTHLCFTGKDLNGTASLSSLACGLNQAGGQITVIGSVGSRHFQLWTTPAGGSPKEQAAFGTQDTVRLQVTDASGQHDLGASHAFQLQAGRAVFKATGLPAAAPTVFVTGEVDCPPARRPVPLPVPVQGSSQG